MTTKTRRIRKAAVAPAGTSSPPNLTQAGFVELPARPLVVEVIDFAAIGQKLVSPSDYNAWAGAIAGLEGAIVNVNVQLGEGDLFDPALATAALLAAGAAHVMPIVPRRPAAQSVPGAPGTWEPNLPVPDAFAAWLDARKLPSDISRESVDAEFRALLEAS